MEDSEKYKVLRECLDTCLKVCKNTCESFVEPEWPDHIDDLKEVIRFRNEVSDNAFMNGRLSAFSQIKKYIQKMDEGLLDVENP